MREWAECEQNEQISMWMSLALDDLLDEGCSQQLQQHLDSCPSCRLEWEAMSQISSLFEGALLASPSLGFAIRAERRLEEKVRKRHLVFRGAAVLTGSLSLAGMTAAAVVLAVVAVWFWRSYGSFPGLEQGTIAAVQIASGMGLMGKATSLFLGDLLLQYGLPLVASLAIGVTLLMAIWAWLFVKHPGDSRHNGYA